MASIFTLSRWLSRTTPKKIVDSRQLFSTTSSCLARTPPPKKGGVVARTSQKSKRRTAAQGRSENYNRVRILKQNMFSQAPPPLRMARLRSLRHWTIHRAWLLFRRKQMEAREKERGRMHEGMYNACEELRTTVGPTGRGEGYLYRVAMEKRNVWLSASVPIEYARPQTETPARVAWDHDWKR
jgi:large subunit ribosomal protein L40